MLLMDMRINSRSVEPIERITVEATKSDADDSTQLSEAIEHACPTVFVGRSGVALVLSQGGSGRIVYTGSKPSAAQQEGIDEAIALLGEWWPEAQMPKKAPKKVEKVEEAGDE